MSESRPSVSSVAESQETVNCYTTSTAEEDARILVSPHGPQNPLRRKTVVINFHRFCPDILPVRSNHFTMSGGGRMAWAGGGESGITGFTAHAPGRGRRRD